MAPTTPVAFIVPHEVPDSEGAEHYMLWAASPNGTFMLIEGIWAYRATVRQFAKRCGYTLISTEVGLGLLERQNRLHAEQKEKKRLH
jgi:hypothetical protein